MTRAPPNRDDVPAEGSSCRSADSKVMPLCRSTAKWTCPPRVWCVQASRGPSGVCCHGQARTPPQPSSLLGWKQAGLCDLAPCVPVEAVQTPDRGAGRGGLRRLEKSWRRVGLLRLGRSGGTNADQRFDLRVHHQRVLARVLAPHSGRRGRRFKSGHPDQRSSRSGPVSRSGRPALTASPPRSGEIPGEDLAGGRPDLPSH